MAILFHDGFDHYTSANTTWGVSGGQFVSAGYALTTAYSITVSSVAARISAAVSGAAASNGVSFTSESISLAKTFLRRSVKGWASKIIMGFAARLNAIPAHANGLHIFKLGQDIDLVLRKDLNVQICGKNTKYQIEVGVWYFYEIQYDTATGNVTLWVSNNKAIEFPLTLSAPIEEFHLHASHEDTTTVSNQTDIVFMDDLYVVDGSGQTTNRLGKSNSVLRTPTVNVATSFVAYPVGKTNYGSVTEIYSNGDTDYVRSDVEGAVDVYSNPNSFNVPQDIKAVSIVLSARKEEQDSLGVSEIMRVNGTDYVGQINALRSSVYSTAFGVFELNPNTGQPWAKSEVIASAWGQKLVRI